MINKHKKVGIFTFHFSNNYGALFQAAALRNALQESGANVSFINYVPKNIENKDLIRGLRDGGPKQLLVNGFNLYRGVYASLFQKKLSKEFEKFKKKLVPADLEIDDLHTCDAIVVGSDQIWRPDRLLQIDPMYTLKELGFIGRKMSYAASMGSYGFPPSVYKELSDAIKDFEFVSVRERELQENLNRQSQKNVQIVLDPVLLVNWQQIIDSYDNVLRIEREDYVFTYYLRSKHEVREANLSIKESTNMEILTPKGLNNRLGYHGTAFEMSPIEWIQYASSSRLVTTNTFHGVAMSVALKKDFWFVPLKGNKAGLNARSLNLLSELGLEHRIWRGQSNVLAEIDWRNVEAKLTNLRSESRSFLMQLIK